MSLAAIRPFFRDRMESLGYEEHTDAFDDQNRDQNSLDKMFRIDTGPLVGSSAVNNTHTFEFDVSLVITFSGGSNNVELLDTAIAELESIYADILSPANRYGTAIKSITPGTAAFAPLSGTNDTDLLVTVAFTGLVICEF